MTFPGEYHDESMPPETREDTGLDPTRFVDVSLQLAALIGGSIQFALGGLPEEPQAPAPQEAPQRPLDS